MPADFIPMVYGSSISFADDKVVWVASGGGEADDRCKPRFDNVMHPIWYVKI